MTYNLYIHHYNLCITTVIYNYLLYQLISYNYTFKNIKNTFEYNHGKYISCIIRFFLLSYAGRTTAKIGKRRKASTLRASDEGPRRTTKDVDFRLQT